MKSYKKKLRKFPKSPIYACSKRREELHREYGLPGIPVRMEPTTAKIIYTDIDGNFLYSEEIEPKIIMN